MVNLLPFFRQNAMRGFALLSQGPSAGVVVVVVVIRRRRSYKVRQSYISRTLWPKIAKFCVDIHTNLLYVHARYDVTSYFRSEVIAYKLFGYDSGGGRSLKNYILLYGCIFNWWIVDSGFAPILVHMILLIKFDHKRFVLLNSSYTFTSPKTIFQRRIWMINSNVAWNRGRQTSNDVRRLRRRREFFWDIFSNTLETTRGRNFKSYHNVTHASLYFTNPTDKFSVMFGSQFLDNGSIISKRFTVLERVIQGLHLFLCAALDTFASWAREWGSRGPTVVDALHKWLIQIFSKTTEAINPQVHTSVKPEGIYICTGNDVIGYFRSATNSVSATGAAANFSVRKWFFFEYLGNCYR